MSSEASPISPTQFASALEELPIENLYAKVYEIQNSISHLHISNQELQGYSDSVGGDVDCMAALRENEEVISRMNDRIGLVKKEVERRGQIWHETVVNGKSEEEAPAGGTLNDEELRRQMEDRMADDDQEDGVHL